MKVKQTLSVSIIYDEADTYLWPTESVEALVEAALEKGFREVLLSDVPKPLVREVEWRDSKFLPGSLKEIQKEG